MNNNPTTYHLHNEGNIFAKGSVLVQFSKIVGEEKGVNTDIKMLFDFILGY